VKLPRLPVAVLSLSFAAGAALIASEGYTPTAVVPTKNDRPTVGFGSTFKEDGSPVRMGDTITPPKAVARTAAHIAKDETGLKRCMDGIELNQVEYDVLVDFTYQYGVKRACGSKMTKRYRMADYEAACHAYLDYRFMGDYDCSTLVPVNGEWERNKRCWGVWTRIQERAQKCLAAQ
jgi:lysozyme